jgi:hypothetical protein
MAQREIRRNGSKSALAPILGCPSTYVKAAKARQFRSFSNSESVQLGTAKLLVATGDSIRS